MTLTACDCCERAALCQVDPDDDGEWCCASCLLNPALRKAARRHREVLLEFAEAEAIGLGRAVSR